MDTSKHLIDLPTDENRITQLKLKMIEYFHRLLTDPDNLDAEYKIAILSTLINDGAVDTKQISMKLFSRDGFVDVPTFVSAAAVIRDYVLTGGQGVYFGGLPTGNQTVEHSCPPPA